MQSEHSLDYDTDAPVLIAGDSASAIARAEATVEAAGLRIADRVSTAAAVERLAMQARTGALWVELSKDGGAAMDSLLERIDAEAAAGLYPAIVAAPSALIDAITARVRDAAVELLFDASDADRSVALAMATSKAALAGGVADITSDNSAARLRQLSDEVGRIAATLARLSTGPEAEPAAPPPIADRAIPQIDADVVRGVIRARRIRAQHFPADLFADPAWDMLLDLTQSEIAQHRVPVSSLCIAAAVPPTTALRWIKTMTDRGLFVRRDDPHDGRRVFIEMSPATSDAMRRYFGEVGSPSVV